jgi:Zn-dependent protease with chaperone function
MPIFLVLALVAACLPVRWSEAALGFSPPVAAALTGGAVALVLALALALRTFVVRAVRADPSRRFEVARHYGAWRRRLFFVNVGTAAACVTALGWGAAVQSEVYVTADEQKVLAPFAELLVPLPYFAVLLGCWLIYFSAERALFAAQHPDRPFWTRGGYVLHNARQFVLLVMLPVLLVTGQQTLGRFAPETAQSDAFRIALLFTGPLLVLLLPLLMKPVLGLKPLPPGPTRDRLEALAKRLHFRCSDFLVWHTNGGAINALIAGLIPRARYVVFTDRLLEELPPDELDAVLGHEIGHAKHMHVWLYALFLLLSLTTIAALVMLLAQRLDAAEAPEWVEVRETLAGFESWLVLPPVAVTAAYLFLVFGALSRRCERQADVYGCKAVSCANPNCTSHDDDTQFPEGAKCLCPTGVRTFARALDRVSGGHDAGPRGSALARAWRGFWEWVKHWSHGAIPKRIDYLMGLIDRPSDERRFQRRVFAFKCVLVLGLLSALVALGTQVGWRALLDAL